MSRRRLARLLTGSDPIDLRYARFAGLMAAVFILASALLVWDATHVAESEPTATSTTTTTVLVTPATAGPAVEYVP